MFKMKILSEAFNLYTLIKDSFIKTPDNLEPWLESLFLLVSLFFYQPQNPKQNNPTDLKY
jgi:hypothetical protein